MRRCLSGVSGKRYEEWELDDPADADLAHVGGIRDEIERRVLHLLDELSIPHEPSTPA